MLGMGLFLTLSQLVQQSSGVLVGDLSLLSLHARKSAAQQSGIDVDVVVTVAQAQEQMVPVAILNLSLHRFLLLLKKEWMLLFFFWLLFPPTKPMRVLTQTISFKV
jgi:hypothetical protein